MSGWVNSKLAPIIKEVCIKYFSNFNSDSYNLDLGWTGSGDLQLDNLILRQDVLDQFDLPFKVSYGVIGSLHAGFGVFAVTMGTPDVVITIQDVYLVLSPTNPKPYTKPDPGILRAIKQKEIEVAEKKLVEGIDKDGKGSSEYVAKIILGVINNVKIICERIHLRYEDDITIRTPKTLISFGITLKELRAVSTNENYKEAVTNKTAKTIFKAVEIKEFGVYWNTNSEIIHPEPQSGKNMDKTLKRMKDLLGESNKELDFILGPMTSKIHAMVTMEPQALAKPFSKPRAKVELVLEGLDVQLENEQFRDILLFGDNLEAISRRKPYLKFRPFKISYKGKAKRWWKYAYLCVRQNIERKSMLYNVDVLIEKIHLCKAYEGVYMKLIHLDNPSEADKSAALELEDKLTVVDILAVRRKQQLYKLKLKEARKAKKKWFSAKGLSASEIYDVLNSELSPEDKEQLKDRLDLQFKDDGKQFDYPEAYEEINFRFNLPSFGVKFFEVKSHKEQEILSYVAKNFYFGVDTVPKQKGLRADIKMKDFSVTGIGKNPGHLPIIVRAIKPTEATEFMSIKFEKNPNNSQATHFLRVDVQPLEIIYDAYTFQKLVTCFTWPKGVDLAETRDFAKDLIKNVQNMSSKRIESIVKKQASIDLDIKIRAPYMLIPEAGDYTKNADILAINLGNINVRCLPRHQAVPDPKTIPDEGVGSTDGTVVTPAILKLAYNNFKVKLENLEIFVALGGEDVLAAINHVYVNDGQYHWNRPLTLLKIAELSIELNQCIIPNDPRFPKLKGNLTIPAISLDITDYRLIQLVKLLVKMPIPQRIIPPSALLDGELDRENFTFTSSTDLNLISIQELKINKNDVELKLKLDAETKELYEKINGVDHSHSQDFDPEKTLQYTNLLLNLGLDKIQINLMKLIGEQGVSSSVEPIFDFRITKLKSKFMNRTFGTTLDFSIQTITSECIGAQVYGVDVDVDDPVYLLYSPEAANGEVPLLSCHLFTISPQCPKSKAGAIKQKVDISLSSIIVKLHQESLGLLLGKFDRILNEYQESRAMKPSSPIVFKAPEIKSGRTTKGMVKMLRALTEGHRENPNDILAKLTILCPGITFEVISETKKIVSAKIIEFLVDIEDKALETKIFGQISGVEVANLDEVTEFPFVLSVSANAEHKFIFAELTQQKSEKKEDLDPDINLKLCIFCPKIILQACFIKNITNFIMDLEKQRKIVWGSPAPKPSQLLPVPVKVYGENDLKIKMHLQLKAPKIIFLRKDDSYEAWLVDSGMLSINNSFETEETGDSKHKAVIDKIEICLEGIIGTGVLISVQTQDVDLQAQNYSLYPTKLDFKVGRNLSFAWFDKIPKIQVGTGLVPIPLMFGFGILEGINENI